MASSGIRGWVWPMLVVLILGSWIPGIVFLVYAQSLRAPKESIAVHDKLAARSSTCTSPVALELNDGSRAVTMNPAICICKDLAVRACGAPGH